MKSPFRLAIFTLAMLATFLSATPRPASATQQTGRPKAQAAPAAGAESSDGSSSTGAIPGPLRSFLRMAGISQKISPEEVLPFLARNVVVLGYPDLRGNSDNPSEFMHLLKKYVQQARELQTLAGQQAVIRVSTCSEAQSLLGVLGYRLHSPCGPDTSMETSDADRAFLTIDSGFPVADLEETLRGGAPFVYAFPTTFVPMLYTQNDWGTGDKKDEKNKGDILETLLNDPSQARLYWALSRMDNETRMALKQSPGLPKLAAFGGLLDFFGSHIYIRSGRVIVPGGAPAEASWKQIVGADPDSPAEFIVKLLSKDEGWLAAYFDAMARAGQKRQEYFTQANHLQRFYQAYRGQDVSPGPSKHSYRPDPGLFLLVSRLSLDANGQPHVPGNLDVWKEIIRKSKNDSKVVRDWSKRADRWTTPEEFLEGMFAFARSNSSSNPLKMYLTFNEIDRRRSAQQRLAPDTVRLMAARFPRFSDQYPIFAEFNGLSNASIVHFINTAEALDRISDRVIRADALGILQANMGLWQILARQGQIPAGSMNESWQQVLAPFASANTSPEIFDAARASLSGLSHALNGKTEFSQDELIAALAGPSQQSADGQQMRQEIAGHIRAVMDDQRLVSLDTLFSLGRGLTQMSQGKDVSASLAPLAGELREFQMPRPLFTTRERTEWASGLYNVRHTTSQMQTTLVKLIQTPGTPAELAVARGQLTSFVRDTLVGLNYAYYEPPGAQMLHHNPLFVRSHDFSGQISLRGDQAWQTPFLFGRGGTASGGAHLAGSLIDLPYVLAEVEQDFIIPENSQSLIWEDLVPDIVTASVLARWWGISSTELHAVTLYQRTGEELLAASASDAALRDRVIKILSERMLPQRFEQIEQDLKTGRAGEVLPQMLPAETFFLAAEFRRQSEQNAAEKAPWGAAGKELDGLAAQHPAEVSWARISQHFGVPHPAMAQSYALELLDVKPFPTFLGYSSRLLAECWDSSNLYWARIADEMGLPSVMLNRLVPQLTHRMIEKIAATHPEDLRAVLRAMQETGEEFRRNKNGFVPGQTATPAAQNGGATRELGQPGASVVAR